MSAGFTVSLEVPWSPLSNRLILYNYPNLARFLHDLIMSDSPHDDSNRSYVFVLTGSDTSDEIVGDHTQGVAVVGNNDAWRLIPDDVEWRRCHIGPNYFRQDIRYDFSRCSAIFNLVSDADLNPATLRVAQRLTVGYQDRLINDPRYVRRTGRDTISRTLVNLEGLHVPKVLRLRNPTLARLRKRMAAEEFSFPAIVRRVGTQTGRIIGLFRKPEDLADHLNGLKGEYYFTEYVECRWSDGLYRKMRLVYIGGEVIFDHMFINDSWLVNADAARTGIMKEREDLRHQERRIFEGDAEHIMAPARRIMIEIANRINLDYFGIDCSPTEAGEFVLFEANATMNIAKRSTDPLFAYAQQGSVPRAKKALRHLLARRTNLTEKQISETV